MCIDLFLVFFSSRRRHTRCALVTGVQTCARPISPAVEVALCGHATLASGHALMEGDSVRFLTRKAGILEVRRIGPGYELDLPAWESVPKALPDIVAGMRQEPAKTLWREGGYGLLVYENEEQDRKSTRLNSSHYCATRLPSSD